MNNALENKVENYKKNNQTADAEHITLTDKQLKLFNLLKIKSASSPDNWPSKEEIAKELGVNETVVNTVLNSLMRKEGIDILVNKNTQGQIPRYAIDPLVLEKTVVGKDHNKNNSNEYCALYLAEPAFGTKAFDDTYTMKGLALFLKANGYADKIGQVIIQGGVIPHVPPFSSKGYNNDLKFLGQIPRFDAEKSYSEKWLEDKIANSYEKKHYEKYINNKKDRKIVNLTDAFYAAGIQIKNLMQVLPQNTILRMQSGEEDRKNIEHLENAYVSAWAKEKATQIEEDREEIEEKLTELNTLSNNYTFKKETIESILTDIDKKLALNKKETKKEYITRIAKVLEDKAKLDKNIQNNSVYENTAKIVYSTIKAKNIDETINKNIDYFNNALAKVNTKIEFNKSQIESLDDTAKWTEQLMGEGRMSAVTWFTAHYPIFASELELIYKKSKDHYSKNFFEFGIKQHATFHASSRKQVTIDTGVINNIQTGEKDQAIIEYDTMETGKKSILMIHNLNSSFSDNASSANIKDAKLLSNYNNMVLQKFYSDVDTLKQPDIMLLGGHGLGGFRVMPWFKESEHIIDGEFIKGQEISYLIDLPTLQSVPKLESIIGKISNNHTKRYAKGPYGTGAVIHTENADKVNSFTIVDTAKLIEFGKLATEIETYEKYLNGETVTEEVKTQLQNIVKETYKKIEAAGDMHIGDADNMDRYSKYELIKASQIYQEKNGLPNIVSWDEVLHGTESRIFNSASRYEAKTPEHFQTAVIDVILNNPNLNSEQKLQLMAREAKRNHMGITIPNASLQLREAKRLLEPYVNKILDNNGKMIFMSGNHYNKSTRDSDEATQLASALCRLEYLNTPQVLEFNGNGNDVGLGTIRLEGDKKLFAMHKFPTSNDEIYGIFKHMVSMNNNSDIIIAGDRHQTGAGYANGQLAVLHPGYETINKYVPLIGKPAGLRGLINVHYDVNHKGVYTVDFVLNPTLEKIIEERNIM